MSKNNNDEKEYWREDVARIAEDSEHSSVYLAEEALKIIENFVQNDAYRNRTELLQNLSKLGNALVRAKPLMALIYGRAHRTINFIQSIPKEERDIARIRNLALEEINTIRQEAKDKLNKITRLGARLIMDQHVVLTHSASSIIESILLQAKKQKKRFRLICTESRPKYEGAKLAERMAKAGIKTTIIPDADIYRAVNEAHFTVVGTDRITENSFINKTGTAAIALISKEMNKPLYVAGDTAKILLKRIYPVRFSSQNEQELSSAKTKHLTLQNYYFEEIPLEYVRKLICETSIFEREEFVERFL